VIPVTCYEAVTLLTGSQFGHTAPENRRIRAHFGIRHGQVGGRPWFAFLRHIHVERPTRAVIKFNRGSNVLILVIILLILLLGGGGGYYGYGRWGYGGGFGVGLGTILIIVLIAYLLGLFR
jgi:hypothetical protein